jgi:hypothetical protein
LDQALKRKPCNRNGSTIPVLRLLQNDALALKVYTQMNSKVGF